MSRYIKKIEVVLNDPREGSYTYERLSEKPHDTLVSGTPAPSESQAYYFDKRVELFEKIMNLSMEGPDYPETPNFRKIADFLDTLK